MLFAFLVWIFSTNVVFGLALHIGDISLELTNSTDVVTRRLEHSLNIKAQDGQVWFLDFVPTFIPNTVHVKFDDTVYSGCTVGTSYWCIMNGNLYWADPDLYLLSKNTQYINTNYVPTLNTAVEMVMADKSSLTYDLFGVKNGIAAGTNSGFGISLDSGKFGFFRNGQSVQAINKDDAFHYYYLSNTDAILDNTHYDFPSANEPIDISRPMYAFGFNHVGAAYDKAMAIKWIKIYERGVLVRHFVPVTKDLVIGDFTVPEDGMFEIIEQRFYQNSGTGSFSVSRDGGLM